MKIRDCGFYALTVAAIVAAVLGWPGTSLLTWVGALLVKE